MKNFISIKDCPDPGKLLEQALKLKENPNGSPEMGKHKTLGLLFLNPSLRTRLSTQKAAYNLGMHVIVMNLNSDSWTLEMEDGSIMNGGSQEHIKDAAMVISQYCDIIGIRTFAGLKDREADYSEIFLKKFIQHVSVPVLSLESATLHPLQSLADWMTISQYKARKKPKVVISWAPHPKALPQAVANSFVEWMQVADVELVVTNPQGFDLSQEIVGNTPIIHNQEEAFAQADFVYAKNWSSFQNYGQIDQSHLDWTITPEKMALTNQAKFMHCLPVRRNVVAQDAVLDAPYSLIYEQANNRTFAAQAVLTQLLRS